MADRSNTRPEPEETAAAAENRRRKRAEVAALILDRYHEDMEPVEESFTWDLDALLEKANRLEGPVALLLAASLDAMRERYEAVAGDVQHLDRVVGRLEHAEDQVVALNRTVRTQRLEVVDRQGRVRALIDDGKGDCFGLRLFDIHGTAVAWANVYDVEGAEPAEQIEGQGGFFLARGGDVVGSLAVGDYGVSLSLEGSTGDGGFEWEVAEDGRTEAHIRSPRPAGDSGGQLTAGANVELSACPPRPSSPR